VTRSRSTSRWCVR